MRKKFTLEELDEVKIYLDLQKAATFFLTKITAAISKITDADGITIGSAEILEGCEVIDGELYQNGDYLGEECDNYFVEQHTIGDSYDWFMGYIYFATAKKGTYIGFHFEC